MSIFQVVGLLGFLAYLGSFAALQMKLLDGNGVVYAALNILAASLVLVSLVEAFNLASALIQVSWICIGLCGLIWRLVATSHSDSDREAGTQDQVAKTG
jgi:uncharacterized membrane protein YqjE